MLKILFVILCLNHHSFATKSRPKTELLEAIIRFIRFAPSLLGYNFTEEDKAQYSTGSKLKDVHLKINEMLKKYGYPVEEYELTTEDGYILHMFRIRGAGRPVLLMHGLFLSADDWVGAGPENGIAYLLADEGFDVWLGNVRGTKHSRTHIMHTPHSAAYWDFSWDEMGRYDLPAMIDFVLTTTNFSQLIYVGHSQGTTSFFVMASEKPQYNNKISLMVGLAPATALANLKSPLLQFLNYATLLHADFFFARLREFGLIDLTTPNLITEIFASTFCAKSEVARDVCNNLVYASCDINHAQLNFTTLPSVISHFTPEVAFKQIEHYTQTLTSQRFARFDYGAEKNEVLYGSRVSPDYNISSITTPIAMLYSVNDWLASEKDTHILRKQLKNVVEFYPIADKKFTHIDFMYAKDVKELVFKPMLKQIKKSLKYDHSFINTYS